MSEGIKEILERLERIDHKEYIAFEFADSATFDEVARCFEERKKMADYITNLQEEIHKKEAMYDSLAVNYRLSQEENEILKENAIHNDKVVDKAKWNEIIYKSRCEKAIEYIDNYDVFKEFTFPLMKRNEENQVKSSIDYQFKNDLKKNLLNILNGGDKE